MMSLATGPNTSELTDHGLNQQKQQAKACVDLPLVPCHSDGKLTRMDPLH